MLLLHNTRTDRIPERPAFHSPVASFSVPRPPGPGPSCDSDLSVTAARAAPPSQTKLHPSLSRRRRLDAVHRLAANPPARKKGAGLSLAVRCIGRTERLSPCYRGRLRSQHPATKPADRQDQVMYLAQLLPECRSDSYTWTNYVD